MFNILGNAIEPITSATETAGTVYTKLLQPRGGSRICVVRATFTVAATAHALTVMRPLNLVLTTAAAAKDQKVIKISSDPGLAQGDYCAVMREDGKYQLNKVDSISTLDITFDDNWTVAIEKDAKVFFFGDEDDGHERITLAANSEITYESPYGFFVGNAPGWPMVFHVDNETNASFLRGGTIVHGDA